MFAGKRIGGKSELKDLEEAIWSLERAIQMLENSPPVDLAYPPLPENTTIPNGARIEFPDGEVYIMKKPNFKPVPPMQQMPGAEPVSHPYPLSD